MGRSENILLDGYDLKLLAELQRDSALSNVELAGRVGLSATPCWNRVRKLEDAGVISRRVALVDPEKVGLGVTVFAFIRTNAHDHDWLEAFADHVRAMPEVVEFYRLSGEVDYLLKMVVSGISDYDRVYKELIAGMQLHDVSSSFSMEQIKYTTEMPLPKPTTVRR